MKQTVDQSAVRFINDDYTGYSKMKFSNSIIIKPGFLENPLSSSP